MFLLVQPDARTVSSYSVSVTLRPYGRIYLSTTSTQAEQFEQKLNEDTKLQLFHDLSHPKGGL